MLQVEQQDILGSVTPFTVVKTVSMFSVRPDFALYVLVHFTSSYLEKFLLQTNNEVLVAIVRNSPKTQLFPGAIHCFD